MYRFSLAQFVQLFEQALHVESYKGDKLQYTQMHLISIVYDSISVGLLKSHRLGFAITLAKALFPERVPDSGYNVLLGNALAEQKPTPRWVPAGDKPKFQTLMSNNVIGPVNFDDGRWEDWYKSANC
jgi:hypothetical protein